MTCREVRDYLFAFLDNELEAALSVELQRHLERCPHCAHDAETERTIRRRLADRLNEASAPPVFAEDALARDLGLAGAPPTARRRRPVAMAAAIVAAVLLTLVARALWPAPRLADLLVTDFEHFIEEGKPLQLASADSAATRKWLREQVGLDIRLPDDRNGTCTLIGARRCTLAGQPTAFAVYEIGGAPVALAVVARGGLDVTRMQAVERNDQTHWTDRCRGHVVVARVDGPLIYAAVSTLPEEKILCLLPGAIHESD